MEIIGFGITSGLLLLVLGWIIKVSNNIGKINGCIEENSRDIQELKIRVDKLEDIDKRFEKIEMTLGTLIK